MAHTTVILLVFALFCVVARSHLSWSHTGWGDDYVEKMEETEDEKYDAMQHAVIEKLKADHATVHSHEAVDKMLTFLKDHKDHLVGDFTSGSKTVELHFHDTARTFPLCFMPYTVGPLHLTVHDGDSISCADQRVAPRIKIKEYGELVTDGLYALVVVDRDLKGYGLYGWVDAPYLHLLILNIHGSDVKNGYLIKDWESTTFSNRMQVFLYRQSGVIYNDFRLGRYVAQGNGCRAFDRCGFSQIQFAKDYDLVLESVSTFVVYSDPWYPWSLQKVGLMTEEEACMKYVAVTAKHVMAYLEVNTSLVDDVLKMWEKYTLNYMSESGLEDYYAAFEHQRAHLRGYYSGIDDNIIIPWHTVYTHKVGFWFKSKPEAIGPMCDVKFNLPGVDRKCFLEGKDISAAVLRDMPRIRIMDAETHDVDSENYFTLILADRLEGVFSLDAQTKDEPYLWWFVMNIKDNDLEHANHMAPYLPAYPSNATVMLLYKQLAGHINDFPIYSYTGGKCASQARCRFEVERFRERYRLQLVAADHFTVTGDVYSAMEGIRRGSATPDRACERYLKAIKHD